MLNIPLQEAQNKLPELINLVEQGEEIFILGDNKTRIKLVSFSNEFNNASNQLAKRNNVILGTLAGAFAVPENFDDPLPEDLCNAFYNPDL
jgi:antitoxin (DNA-binding transcriptional repressor) of toxin-antitoxin stability system